MTDMTPYTSISFAQLHERLATAKLPPDTDAPLAAPLDADSADEGSETLGALFLGSLPRDVVEGGALRATVLRPESEAELALLFLLLLANAYKDNQKAPLLAVVKQAVAEVAGVEVEVSRLAEVATPEFVQALDARFETAAASWPFQRLVRGKTGGLKMSLELVKAGNGLDAIKGPAVQDDDARLAAILAGVSAPAELLAALPELDQVVHDLRTVCLAASHPAVLSTPHGKSGAHAQWQEPDLDAPGCVTEFDYQTLQTETFVSGAHVQKFTWLTCALVHWQGSVVRLRTLLQQDAAVHAAVAAGLASLGLARVAEVLEAYLQPDMPACEGAPTVFAVVPGAGRPQVQVLSVLTPFAHLIELLEVRSHIRQARVNEVAEASRRELAELDATHASAGAVGKAEAAKQVKDRKELVAKHERIAKIAPFTRAPHRRLTVGGSTPRNVCAGLTQSHHTANLAPLISLNRSVARRNQLGRLVYTPRALVIQPARLEFNLARLEASKSAREAFIGRLIEQAAAPLLELRDAYVNQRAGKLGLPAFTPADLSHLHASDEAWALFVRGSDVLNYAGWRLALEPLASTVMSKVKATLSEAAEGALNVFDAQTYRQCLDYLMQHHA